MRRVLIISPNFAPLNTPDMQRVRLALPHLRENGWEPAVVAVEPDMSGTGIMDPLLESTYPADIRIERVRGIPPSLTRRVGLAGIWWRCGRALRRKAEDLLRTGEFDLVFFSTTVFSAFSEGPRWQRKFGVPYVLDYQDPWLNPYYQRTGTRPPGGRIKFGLTQWLASRREPAAVRNAAGIVSVSDAYSADLVARYGIDPARCRTLPFGAAPGDLAVAAGQSPAHPLVNFGDGKFHLVYTGRCGPDMAFTLAALFRAFARYLRSAPDEARRIQFHFVGTGYAPPPLGREWVAPVAAREGVGDFVHEHCYRIPYFDALRLLLNATGLLVPGSTDASYSASKLYPYVLARRPMLLVFPEASPVMKFAASLNTGTRIPFAPGASLDAVADTIYRDWFAGGAFRTSPRFDERAFAPFTAAYLTRELAQFFDRCADARERDTGTT